MSADALQQPTFASFYDFYDGPEGREAQFDMYRSLSGGVGSPVLELACGTGIITIDLARAGFQVTGLDVSPDMLEVAREKVSREDADVQSHICLVEGDMKDFKLDSSFSLIFIPSNSFAYLTELEDHKSCLQAIYAHLSAQGLMVIEERQYTPDLLARMYEQRGTVREWASGVNPATGRHTSRNSFLRHIDFVTQTIYERTWIDEVQDDGTVRRYVRQTGSSPGTHYSWDLRHYFNRFELQLLIEQAGFTIRDLWGGPDRHPLGPRSHNMVFVAQKD